MFFQLHYVIFCFAILKSDVTELIIVLISTWFMKIQWLMEGISKLIKMLVSCNGVYKIFFSQAYNRLIEIYIYFDLEFFWSCKILKNPKSFQIKIFWTNIP